MRALPRSAAIGRLTVALAAGSSMAHAGQRVSPQSPRIAALEQRLAHGDTEAVRQFWREIARHGTPLIEPLPGDAHHVLLTFLYRSARAPHGVAVESQLFAGNPSSERALEHLGGSDVWFATVTVRRDLRFSYGFVPERPQRESERPAVERDSLNPLALAASSGSVGPSLAELPGAAPQPWIVPDPALPGRPLVELDVWSRVLGGKRQAWIYTPPGYDARRPAPYPLLVCFDGAWFANANSIPTTLDNLISRGRIPPTIAVFVGQSPQPQRNLELDNNEAFADFVAEELLSAVRGKWHVTTDPARTVACGASSGGLASAFVAYRRPEVFGNVLSESGAFWPGHTRDSREWEWLTRQLDSSPGLPIRFVLHVGILETAPAIGIAPSIVSANRHLRNVLVAKRYEVHFAEVAGGHEPVSWRGGIADGLIELLRVAPEPVATPAIGAITAALRTHSAVAIGEMHWLRAAGDFYVALVRDSAFQHVATDVVIEFASGQSQSLLDRYVVSLDSIPPDSVRSIWRNTTKAASWESPIYARWLAAIRDVNRTLPAARRIRVIAGDTPVDWTSLHRPADWTGLGDNNISFAHIIADSIIARNRKALVVLGNNHLARGGTFRDRLPNTASLVEQRFPSSMYLILMYAASFADSTSDARIAAERWPAPALLPLRGSWFGARTINAGALRTRLDDLADALLYLGPAGTLVQESPPDSSFEPAYRRELIRRSWIEWGDSSRLVRFLPVLKSPT